MENELHPECLTMDGLLAVRQDYLNQQEAHRNLANSSAQAALKLEGAILAVTALISYAFGAEIVEIPAEVQPEQPGEE